MTQIEAVVRALKILGGKGELKYIYMIAIDIIDEHNSNDIKANIRRCLYANPKLFYPLKEKGDGWWGLVSYQNELNERDLRIMELDAEIKVLRNRPTLESFMKLLLEVTMNLFRIQRGNADYIRQVLSIMGLKKEEAVLAAFIESKESKLIKAIESLAKNPKVQVNVQPGATAQITEQGITNSYLRIPQ
ncbi:MAG: hypothetical protein J5658_12580 [Prevotella sp.]|nr:hypothetical protein [Prevotella sp.]